MCVNLPLSVPTVNHTDKIIRDVLAKGIADADIQLDLFCDKNQNMTLEEVIQFIEAKESRKRSASRLLDTHATEAAKSYRKSKREEMECCYMHLLASDEADVQHIAISVNNAEKNTTWILFIEARTNQIQHRMQDHLKPITPHDDFVFNRMSTLTDFISKTILTETNCYRSPLV